MQDAPKSRVAFAQLVIDTQRKKMPADDLIPVTGSNNLGGQL